MKNMYEMLQHHCSIDKDMLFLVRENVTRGDFLVGVKKRATTLAKKFKVKKGDVVGILSVNTPDFIKTYFALTSLGAKVLMLDTGLVATEHSAMMKITDCKLCLAQKNFFTDCGVQMHDIETPDDTNEKYFVAGDVNLSDIAQLSFTSGTSGKAKVVGLTHGNLVALGDGMMQYSAVLKPGDIMYGFLPLYHIYGVVVNIMAPVCLRMPLLLQTNLRPDVILADFKKYRPHAIPAVPRVWEGFYKKIMVGVKEKGKLKSGIFKTVIFAEPMLRKIGLGGVVDKITKPVRDLFGGRVSILCSAGAVFKPNIRKFYEALGMTVGDCYGLTETTGPANFNLKFTKLDGTLSWAGPLPGNEIKIHNPGKDGIGEIWFRGNLLMSGYVNNDEANAESFEDGWFKTGDLGVIDSRGRLTVKGRAKQLIVLDTGKNVYPDELEDLYLQNEGILAAAVFERNMNGKTVAYGVFQVEKGITVDAVKNMLRISNLSIAPYKWV
ncbi:MAG: AMP-binding protein, partial [Alphaproteobacteria bacterium]|nr:AMP-binding protein [Alphaproteobacteria bacterium]